MPPYFPPPYGYGFVYDPCTLTVFFYSSLYRKKNLELTYYSIIFVNVAGSFLDPDGQRATGLSENE